MKSMRLIYAVALACALGSPALAVDNSILPVCSGAGACSSTTTSETFANKDIAGVKFPKQIPYDSTGADMTDTTNHALKVVNPTAANFLATVVNAGTFAVQAGQTGTWTVQPGNTANTTPWLFQGNVSNASDAVATGSISSPSIAYNFGFNGTTWDRLQVDGSKQLKVIDGNSASLLA